MKTVGIYIGTHPETVRAFNESIMEILGVAGVSEETRQTALKVLGKGVKSPDHSTVQNCNIHMETPLGDDGVPEDEPTEYPEDDDEYPV